MADVVPTTRFVTALGPVKVEFIEFTGTVTISTGGTQTGVDTADTYTSSLVTPKFAFVQTDVDGADGWATSISNKVITLTNSGVSAQTVKMIVVGH